MDFADDSFRYNGRISAHWYSQSLKKRAAGPLREHRLHALRPSPEIPF